MVACVSYSFEFINTKFHILNHSASALPKVKQRFKRMRFSIEEIMAHPFLNFKKRKEAERPSFVWGHINI